MPINFSSLEDPQIHRINYKKLFDHFNSFPIFKDKNIQMNYFKEWMFNLEFFDKEISLFFPKRIRHFLIYKRL